MIARAIAYQMKRLTLEPIKMGPIIEAFHQFCSKAVSLISIYDYDPFIISFSCEMKSNVEKTEISYPEG